MTTSAALCLLVSLLGVLSHWKEAEDVEQLLQSSRGETQREDIPANNESAGHGARSEELGSDPEPGSLPGAGSGAAHVAAMASSESLAALSSWSTLNHKRDPLVGRRGSSKIQGMDADSGSPIKTAEAVELSSSSEPSAFMSPDDVFGGEFHDEQISSGMSGGKHNRKHQQKSSGISSGSDGGVISVDDLSTVLLVMVCFAIALAIVVSVFASVAIMCRYNVSHLRGLHGSRFRVGDPAGRARGGGRPEHKSKYGAGRVLTGETVHGATLSPDNRGFPGPESPSGSVAPALYSVIPPGVVGAHDN